MIISAYSRPHTVNKEQCEGKHLHSKLSGAEGVKAELQERLVGVQVDAAGRLGGCGHHVCLQRLQLLVLRQRQQLCSSHTPTTSALRNSLASSCHIHHLENKQDISLGAPDELI